MIKLDFLHLLGNIFTFNKLRASINVIRTREAFTFEYVTELIYLLQNCNIVMLGCSHILIMSRLYSPSKVPHINSPNHDL